MMIYAIRNVLCEKSKIIKKDREGIRSEVSHHRPVGRSKEES